MNTNLSIYENAKYWIAQYESVDELRDYLDKASVIEQYAKRANDYELEINAGRARVRAERRCGELLKEMDKAKGAATPRGQTDVPRLDEMGLTKNQSSKYQQLANVPEKEFEESINVPGSIPSAHGILRSRKKEEKRIDADALYLWGRLNDFERKLFGRALDELLDEMTPAMRQDAERILPIIRNWLR
jgi:hypothetical protein